MKALSQRRIPYTYTAPNDTAKEELRNISMKQITFAEETTHLTNSFYL